MQNLENLDVFEILITQRLLKCPNEPLFVRSRSYIIDHPKFVASNQNKEYISIYRVNPWPVAVTLALNSGRYDGFLFYVII